VTRSAPTASGAGAAAAAEPAPLCIEIVLAGTAWYRIHRAAHDPLWFGPAPGAAPEFRFDAPNGEYRICYLGASPEASFAETFLRRPPVRLISRTELAARELSRVVVRRELRLAALHGQGLARAGVAGEVTMGIDYARSRAVALELWRHPEQVDGVSYQCRHDSGELAIALFSRAHHPRPALTVEKSTRLTAEPLQLAVWAERYGFGII
jgi:hypothetical protein